MHNYKYKCTVRARTPECNSLCNIVLSLFFPFLCLSICPLFVTVHSVCSSLPLPSTHLSLSPLPSFLLCDIFFVYLPLAPASLSSFISPHLSLSPSPPLFPSLPRSLHPTYTLLSFIRSLCTCACIRKNECRRASLCMYVFVVRWHFMGESRKQASRHNEDPLKTDAPFHYHPSAHEGDGVTLVCQPPTNTHTRGTHADTL